MISQLGKKIIVLGILAVFLAGTVWCDAPIWYQTAQAASKSQLKNRLAELKTARAEADAAVKALQGKAEQYSEKIAALDYQVQTTREELLATQEVIDVLTDDIAEKEIELEETIQTLTEKQDLFETRIRVMYENGETSYLEVLLSSKDFSDMLSNMEVVSQIMDYDKQVVKDYTALKEQIALQKDQLEQARSEKQDYADALKKNKKSSRKTEKRI